MASVLWRRCGCGGVFALVDVQDKRAECATCRAAREARSRRELAADQERTLPAATIAEISATPPGRVKGYEALERAAYEDALGRSAYEDKPALRIPAWSRSSSSLRTAIAPLASSRIHVLVDAPLLVQTLWINAWSDQEMCVPMLVSDVRTGMEQLTGHGSMPTGIPFDVYDWPTLTPAFGLSLTLENLSQCRVYAMVHVFGRGV